MPRPKRWFNVSQDINSDPEFDELCLTCGLSGVRLFLEIMAMLERTDNRIKVTTNGVNFIRSLGTRIGGNARSVEKSLCFMVQKKWLCFGKVSGNFHESFGKVSGKFAETLSELSQNNGYIFAPNYLKYKGNRAHEKSVSCSPPFLTLNRENSSAHHSAVKTPFPGDSLEQTIDDILKEKPWRNEQEEPAFERLWKAWPKKDHYLQAKIAWLEMRPTSEDYKVLLEQVAKREAYGGEWAGDNRRYCPQLAKYLREKRWKDGI